MLHMNYDKLAILLRNQRLMTLVEESIGKPTSLVFCAILRSIENNVEYFDASSEDISEESGDTISFRHLVSTKDICLNFPDTKELEQGVGHADTQNIDSEQLLEKSKRKKPQLEDEAEVSGKASSDEEEDDVRSQTDEPQMNGNVHNADANFQRDRLQIEIVRKHLLLLVEHPYHFLYHHRKAHARGESWSVHFPSLVQHLRTQELDHTINARYGDHALRLVRLLQEKGKVDEKTLSRLSLLNQKLMRASLAAMHAGGHLELQEVPRDAIRAPSRTIFLWHFDPERCRLKLLEEVYKAMTRHLQRMRVEKEEMRSLLDKSRRTDVIGREAELLSTQEIRSLGEWNRKEEVFLGEISRLDDLIIVLGNVGGQFGAR